MSAITLEVLAIQLRQIQSQIEQLHNDGSGTLWDVHADLSITDLATIATRLDDARYAVRMAWQRAEVTMKNNRKALPVCANDGKRDPKPDSGDDPRWQGPEYDKYESDERRGA